MAFDPTYGSYGGFFVRAEYRDREAFAIVIPMRIAGPDENADTFVFRVKTQRPEAKDMFAHIVYPTLESALEIARTETRIAVYHDGTELLSL